VVSRTKRNCGCCVGLLPIEVWRDERYSLQASAPGKVERLLRRRASKNAGPVLGSARGNLAQPQLIPERVESKAGVQLFVGGHQRSTLTAKRGDRGGTSVSDPVSPCTVGELEPCGSFGIA
jgi:hypothetical protein